eukprot:NODE_13938_length_1137_cov_6.865347.p2 GENE.NODE_13938_length_1137_cov_6.865347~~NODE_13938_length_1137_cov_6.865347.p2  ORF type:complete len:70 (-),score=5.04 NODE_13938_length_1137_cov_6.865347:58-267(-)
MRVVEDIHATIALNLPGGHAGSERGSLAGASTHVHLHTLRARVANSKPAVISGSCKRLCWCIMPDNNQS